MVVNGKVFTLEPDITVGADDEIFLELAQASDVGSGFLANAMATMIYDIPALPGLDIQKLDILCNVALKVIKEFSYIELTDILPKHWSFWMTPS
jgi:hypothetical protein